MRWSAPVLVCCALVTVSVAAYEAATARPSEPPVRTVANWRAYVTGGNRIGPADAAVTLVVFNDYECPFSRALARQLGALAVRSPTQFSVIYRAFPLDGHALAHEAAVAAECADRQGKFAAFHELLMTLPVSALGGGSWNVLAERSGVPDTSRFARCRTSADVLAKVNADRAAGEVLGVTSTPGLLVNDQLHAGLPTNVEQVIARANRP